MNYDRQMKAWALDRAIETLKLRGNTRVDADEVMKIAQEYTDWVCLSPPEEEQMGADQVLSGATEGEHDHQPN